MTNSYFEFNGIGYGNEPKTNTGKNILSRKKQNALNKNHGKGINNKINEMKAMDTEFER